MDWFRLSDLPLNNRFNPYHGEYLRMTAAANQNSTSTQIQQRGSNMNLPNRVGSSSNDRGSYNQSFSQIPCKVQEQFDELVATLDRGDSDVLAWSYFNFGYLLHKEKIKFTAPLQGQLSEFSAMQCCSWALQINPNHACYFRMMGDVLQGVADFIDMETVNGPKRLSIKDCYAAALKIYPDDADSFNKLGLALQPNQPIELTLNGCVKEFSCIDCFCAAWSIDKNSSDALNNLGIYLEPGYTIKLTLNEKEELCDYKRCFQEALKIDPHNGIYLFNLGHKLKLEDSVELASFYGGTEIFDKKMCLQSAIESNQLMGFTLLNAEKELNKLSLLNSTNEQLISQIPDEFKEKYHKLIDAVHRGDISMQSDCYFSLGMALKERTAFTAPLKNKLHVFDPKNCFRASIEVDPKNADHFEKLGDALTPDDPIELTVNGETQTFDNKACFAKALAIRPRDAGTFIKLGLALKPDEPIELTWYGQELVFDHLHCFVTASAIDPNSGDAFNNLGIFLEPGYEIPLTRNKIKQSWDYKRCFQEALKIDPLNAAYLVNLGRKLKPKPGDTIELTIDGHKQMFDKKMCLQRVLALPNVPAQLKVEAEEDLNKLSLPEAAPLSDDGKLATLRHLTLSQLN
jgi:tetratricopeptide (TPR) repeat protein